jgi:hypothetical protein
MTVNYTFLPACTHVGPLAVWDANDRSGLFWDHWSETHVWAIEHLGRDVANRTYRVEFFLVDAPFAVLHCFSLNADGRKYTDPATGGTARAKPVVQMLDELPPAHLMGR